MRARRGRTARPAGRHDLMRSSPSTRKGDGERRAPNRFRLPATAAFALADRPSVRRLDGPPLDGPDPMRSTGSTALRRSPLAAMGSTAGRHEARRIETATGEALRFDGSTVRRSTGRTETPTR